jgi:hypothetical protein
MHYYKHPVYGDIELQPHPVWEGRSVGYWQGRAIVEVDTPEEPEEPDTPPIGGIPSEDPKDCTEDMTALSKDPA